MRVGGRQRGDRGSKRSTSSKRRGPSLWFTVPCGVILLGLLGLSMEGGTTWLSSNVMQATSIASYLSSNEYVSTLSQTLRGDQLDDGMNVAVTSDSITGINLTQSAQTSEDDDQMRRLVETVSTSPVKVTWESLFDRENDLGVRVPALTGKLNQKQVQAFLEPLVRQYLEPFKAGIWRRGFLDVLSRLVVKDMPKDSAKGTASVLFQIKKKRVYLFDPHDVVKTPEKPFYRGRVNELIWMLSRLAKAGRIPDTEFLVSVHDCIQTAAMTHPYRGPKYVESKAVFSIVGCNFSDNIPIPLWQTAGDRGGGYKAWDDSVAVHITDPTPWEEKKNKAVFRGSGRLSMFYETHDVAEKQCDKVGRGKLYLTGKMNPDLMDVGVSGSCGPHRFNLKRLRPEDLHVFKYTIYAEGNCFWADRLPLNMFGPSVVLKQETPCGMYFEPLLKPWLHYVPVNYFWTDLPDRVKWLQQNDEEAVQLVQNANEFAWNFLTLESIELYCELIFKQYTKMLIEKQISIEEGAMDVTDQWFDD